MILYHAISTYQIFSVSVHRLKYHEKKFTVLILPDFIVNKFPKYKKLLDIFDEIYLFPYTKIEHVKDTILKNTKMFYKEIIPYELEEFEKVYISGAHFYFSLLLIDVGKHFSVFEDACGMLKQNQRLYNNLYRAYPIHAEMMQNVGMFELNNPLIDKIFCNKKENEILGYKHKIKNWNATKEFLSLSVMQCDKIESFFWDEKPFYNFTDSIFIITQNFVGLGSMNKQQQEKVYEQLHKKISITRKKIFIKVHPDDEFDYKNIFKEAVIIKEKVPVELLLLNSQGIPYLIFSFSSASEIDQRKYKSLNLAKKYSTLYSFEDEYRSILTILGLKENEL